HSRQVRGPVADAIGEDRPKQVIIADLGVERLNEVIDERRVDADLLGRRALFVALLLGEGASVGVSPARGRDDIGHELFASSLCMGSAVLASLRARRNSTWNRAGLTGSTRWRIVGSTMPGSLSGVSIR